jgi:glycosyltransferase involved in cell wall biosynthesis
VTGCGLAEMRVLVLSPYPPMRGGIASYGGQAVDHLRSEGHQVSVASPEPSDAEYVLDVRQRGAGRRLAKIVRGFDRLVVQFQPEMLGDPGSSRVARGRALLRLTVGVRAAQNTELYVHEVDPGQGPLALLARAITRPLFAAADVLTVHTEREYEDLSRAFKIDKSRIRVISQGEFLHRRTAVTQAAARAALGLPSDQPVFLAIGFLHPRKGFDLAIRAFAEMRSDRARLDVVGSMWRDDDVAREHVRDLRRLADQTRRVQVHEGYLGDEEFDRWIVAADVLVLPYRVGWSSNVMERGLLYDRPVIMSDVGGMSEQGAQRRRVTLVRDKAELVRALREAEAQLLRGS